MKLLREVIIVFGIYYVGEMLSKFFSLPLPGSLIGMILLLLALRFRIVKLTHIATMSDFLLGHLPFFFIPAGVALIAVFPLIQNNWYWIVLLCAITTFLTMGLCGFSIQRMMERKKK